MLRERGASSWSVKVKTDLFKVFSQLGPEMMVEMSVPEASKYLALMNKPASLAATSPTAPVAVNHVKMLFADLASLELIEPSKKKHPVADKEAYWSLTSEGLDVLKLHHAMRLEAAAAKAL